MDYLVLAMTKMLSGICTAGFITETDPVTGLRWVRPVKEHGTLLLGDLTTVDGCVARCSDVLDLNLKHSRPEVPHVEDWVTDFVYSRPRLLRRLEGERRAAFFQKYLDQAPEDVLVHQRRSLCLICPDDLTAHFSLDPYSGKFQARLDLKLGDIQRLGAPVTDLKWRALGREWSGTGGESVIHRDALKERLTAEEIYIALGLSRDYQGKLWLLAIGIHVVPDYDVLIDHNNL